jgi:thiol-disulfide isomerase/thioredoxin
LSALVVVSAVFVGSAANAANFAATLDQGPDGAPIIRLVAPDEPKPAPMVEFIDQAGQTHSLASYRGKVTAVHFWATWCTPCRAELPKVDALAETLSAENFAILPISVDRDGVEVVDAFYVSQEIKSLPLFIDRGLTAFRAFKLSGVPTTIFLDADGNEIARVLGDRDWSRPEIIELVRKLIAGG